MRLILCALLAACSPSNEVVADDELDEDGDGVVARVDCNDADPATFHGSGLYADADRDGFGAGAVQTVCVGATVPESFSPVGGDCDDDAADRFRSVSAFVDDDLDGFGAAAVQLCIGAELPLGYSDTGGDCDDTDGGLYALRSAYPDVDGDGFGEAPLRQVCAGAGLPSGWASNGSDCDDQDGAAWVEIYAYADSDEDGVGAGSILALCTDGTRPRFYANQTGDCAPADAGAWRTLDLYVDADLDGSGAGAATPVCLGSVLPRATAVTTGDCDDGEPLRNPNLPELADDGLDNDCAGGDLTALWGDGIYVAAGGSCSDAAPGTPGAPNCTLPAGIGFAAARQPVFVATGTYAGGVTLADVSIFGGYDSSWARDIAANATRIAGGTTAVRVSGGRVAIEGFDITAADATGGSSIGVQIAAGAVAVVVASSVVASGSAGTGLSVGTRIEGSGRLALLSSTTRGAPAGGTSGTTRGLESSGAEVVVRDSVIEAGSGGSLALAEGLLAGGGSVLIVGGTISGGSGNDLAYGLAALATARVTAYRAELRGGAQATRAVGASLAGGAVGVFENCVIDSGGGTGGGTAVDNGGTALVVNGIVRGQSSGSAVQGLVARAGARGTTLVNAIVEARGAGARTAVVVESSPVLLVHDVLYAAGGILLSHRDAGGAALSSDQIQFVNDCAWLGCAGARSNLDAAPLFDADDVHLGAGSPCIDSGTDPSPSWPVPSDLDGNARPVDGDGVDGAEWDIGVHEYRP